MFYLTFARGIRKEDKQVLIHIFYFVTCMRNLMGLDNKKYILFTVIITLIYGTLFSYADFHDNPIENIKDFFIIFMHWGVILLGTFGLLSLLTLNKYIFSLSFPVLTLICTVLAYFRYTANVSLTPMVIELAFINDARTSLEVVSLPLIVWMICSLIFSFVCVIYRWKKVKVNTWYIYLFVSLFLILLTNGLVPRFVNPVSQRIPYCIYYSLSTYLKDRKIINQERPHFTGEITYETDSLIVVMVLGESLRYDHLQLNGYSRETTPLLAQDSNVVSYPNIYSPYYYTHQSIPYILTRADSLNPELAYEEPSFISIFKKAGFYTSWLANQESVSTYVYFMNESDTLVYANEGKTVYTYDNWLDTDLLPLFDQQLKKTEKNKLILLHTIGSHWWYNSHYPDDFAKFKPEMKSRVVSSSSVEQIVNSYDNTILYTDYFLNEITKRLSDKKAIMIYLSDHGESLGEDGYFIHSDDRPIVHRPAALIWYSDLYREEYPDKIGNLKKNKNKYYNTHFLFHSILDAGSIETAYKDNELSIFK